MVTKTYSHMVLGFQVFILQWLVAMEKKNNGRKVINFIKESNYKDSISRKPIIKYG